MLSKPVVGITSHVATPETVPLEDIQINVNHQQQTLTERQLVA